MSIRKNLTALFVAAIMLLCPLAGTLAEDTHTSYSAGGEVSYSATATWHDLPWMTIEENEQIASLLDALEITGRMGIDGESLYDGGSILLNGREVLRDDIVFTEDGVYVNATYLPYPTAVLDGDAEGYLRNLGAYLDTMTGEGIYEDQFMAVYEMLNGLMQMDPEEMLEQIPMEDIAAMLEAMGFEAMMNEISAFAAKLMLGEAYEGEIGSVFGVETSKAIIYPVEKADLIEFMEITRRFTEGNEAFTSFILEIMKAQDPMYGEISVEDVMAEVPAVFDEVLAEMQNIPDDFSFHYNYCMDDDGNYVLGQLELYIPDGYGDDMVGYMEWLPSGDSLYFELTMAGSGLTFSLQPKDDLPGGVKDNGFTAVLSMVSNGEVDGQMILQTASISSESDGKRVYDGEVLFGFVDGYDEIGARLLVNQIETSTDDSVNKDITLDTYAIYNEDEYPLVTLNLNVQLGDSTGVPFDVDAMEFVQPGQMTQDEFESYMEDTQATLLQQVLLIASALPPQIFMQVMEALY